MLSVESIIKNWDYKHFILYVSICTAEADYIVSSKELEVIKNRMNKFGVSGLNFQALYDEVHSTFEMLKDIQSIELIRGLGERYCSDASSKDIILKILNEIVDADNVRRQTEKNMLREIKWLLEKY